MASSEIRLIAVGSGLLALYGPKFDLFVIVCVVLLARFRGRVQALIAATTFSLVGLGAIATGHRFPQCGVAHCSQYHPNRIEPPLTVRQTRSRSVSMT